MERLGRRYPAWKFEVLPHMLSVEGGELTPTLKVKRNIVNSRYQALIDSMYGGV